VLSCGAGGEASGAAKIGGSPEREHSRLTSLSPAAEKNEFCAARVSEAAESFLDFHQDEGRTRMASPVAESGGE